MPQPEPDVHNNDRHENDAHQKYELMCALAVAHELDMNEQRDFDHHLARCEACRSELGGFRQLVDELADGHATVGSPGFDETEHAVGFQKFAAAEGLAFSNDALHSLIGEGLRSWKPLKFAFATAAVIVILVAGAAVLREWPPAATTPAPVADARPAVIRPVQPNTIQNADHERIAELQSRLIQAGSEAAKIPALEAKLQAEADRRLKAEAVSALREAEIAQAKAAASEEQKQLASAEARIATLSGKNDELTASLVAEHAQAVQLAEDLHNQKLSAELDRQLTAATREVKELMGARRLYMIDVYDGEQTTAANRSFGRVFYTEGKSLIFYAFDLDKKRSAKRVTFAAWGERGKDAGTVKPLGVFNLDDVAQKRWVMKVDDPEKLKSIDAIFVTVESKPGAERPTGQKLLYAFLGGQPNHP